MNKVIFLSRLSQDVEARTSQSGTTIATFNIAVNRKFKRDGDPDADFFRCTCFGKQAEFAEKYLKKGTKVLISGSVHNDNYTDKNGNKVYGTKIMVEEIEFAESKGDKPADKPNVDKDGFMDVADIPEDLPFL